MIRNGFSILAALVSSVVIAQQYDTPETRRQKAEDSRQSTQQKSGVHAGHLEVSNLQRKQVEAQAYIGKEFWYMPNPTANSRIRFYEKVPPSSHSADPDIIFTPLSVTRFVVTGIVMPPPTIYPLGADEYLLEIKFTDGKIGFVNIVGCCGLSQNLYLGRRESHSEYVSIEAVDDILAKENGERQAVELEALRKQRQDDLQKTREEQARRAEIAKPFPRIGMRKIQVLNRTNWGKPNDINRTITAGTIREQWIYGNGRYLYFANDILIAIQD